MLAMNDYEILVSPPPYSKLHWNFSNVGPTLCFLYLLTKAQPIKYLTFQEAQLKFTQQMKGEKERSVCCFIIYLFLKSFYRWS